MYVLFRHIFTFDATFDVRGREGGVQVSQVKLAGQGSFQQSSQLYADEVICPFNIYFQYYQNQIVYLYIMNKSERGLGEEWVRGPIIKLTN